MFSTLCPQCGAPVEFRSAAAVMAVCSFCRSTLLKHGEELARIGEMATVFEDYSPLQLGAAGHFGARAFSVIGRLQLRYDAGFWNEWFIAFGDGASGWLSDASGQYAITEEITPTDVSAIPRFDALGPGTPFDFDGRAYIASDVRVAQCRGGEGELPFVVGDGWRARVADFRNESAFLTLDYSDRETAVVYRGDAVELDALAMHGLRDTEQIRASAGRYVGEVVAFACPSCGAPMSHTVGIADFVICDACHAGVDCTEEQAQVFTKQREADAVGTALVPGAKGVFDGVEYIVLGVMRCRSQDGHAWDEYLLHTAGRGFMWLVHSAGQWERVDVLNSWPSIEGSQLVRFEKKAYSLDETYQSEVTHVGGAFNWRVSVGDVVQVTDFVQAGRAKLTREVSASEIVWSQAQSVAGTKIEERFGPLAGTASTAGVMSVSAKASSYSHFAPLPFLFSIILVFVNFEDLARFDGEWVLVGLALILLWLPEWIWRHSSGDTPASGSGGGR